MISESETKDKSVEVKTPIVEKKKRNYKKKDAVETQVISNTNSTSETPISKQKAKQKPKQKLETHSASEKSEDEEEYKKIKNLIDSNPDVAKEIQNILIKYIK